MGAILRLQVYDYRTSKGVLVEKGGTYAYEANKPIGPMAECNALGYSDARLKIIVKDTAGTPTFEWQSSFNMAGYPAIWDGVTFTMPDRSVIVNFELYGNGVKVDATTLTITIAAPTTTTTTLTITGPANFVPYLPFDVSGKLTPKVQPANLPIKNFSIELSFDGTKIGTAKTDPDGNYGYKVTIEKRGVFTVTANFAGSGYYLPSSAQLKVSSGLPVGPLRNLLHNLFPGTFPMVALDNDRVPVAGREVVRCV